MRAASSFFAVVVVVVVAVVAVGGCQQPYGSRHWPRSREARPQLVLETDVDLTDPAHFFDAPWPADARRLPDGALTALVQAALSEFLSRRGYGAAPKKLRITPAPQGSGAPDVSLHHDQYLAEP